MDITIEKCKNGLNGEITIPADKSISHRAVMFASLADGKSIIKNFSSGKDPLSSLKICQDLGVDANFVNNDLVINSTGKFISPLSPLNCGNSGTTMRFMAGILAGQNFNSTLIGDESLSKRPMKRIIEPLKLMGADITGLDNHAPINIIGKHLHAINYNSELASAQVKSCVLLAGLNCDGETTFTEPYISRNHTEKILEFMEANISVNENIVTVQKSKLVPKTIEICGDISSAAYFIVAALIVPNSCIILKNVGLNPTRTGILEVAKKMGGNIEILDKRLVAGEEAGDIKISYTENLKACIIEGEIIPKLIDELPVIAVLATQAEGTTTVKNAQDLRNKESDRIKSVVIELKKIGADIEETADGFVINGKTPLIGDCQVNTYHDHRLAMSWYVAGLIAKKPINIIGFEWVNISFPEFEKLFSEITDSCANSKQLK